VEGARRGSPIVSRVRFRADHVALTPPRSDAPPPTSAGGLPRARIACRCECTAHQPRAVRDARTTIDEHPRERADDDADGSCKCGIEHTTADRDSQAKAESNRHRRADRSAPECRVEATCALYKSVRLCAVIARAHCSARVDATSVCTHIDAAHMYTCALLSARHRQDAPLMHARE
jgi:hypothetical protein